jgi:catechol 2,3-dioxygenase-like lactoylglutathione lyase family enzyme
MPILLDHTIVPCRDQLASAEWLAGLLGVPWEKQQGPFTPVFLNDTLTLDFRNSDSFESHHYCFHVGDDEFDQIFERIRSAGLKYGSGPFSTDDMKINTRNAGKNVYWTDDDGHVWEMLTVSYARATG